MHISFSLRILAASHYIPFTAPLTCLYVLLVKPSDHFLFPHMRQGFGIFLCWFFSTFVLALFPFLGWILFFTLLATSVHGAYQAYLGKSFSLPFFGFFGKILPFEKIYKLIVGKDFPHHDSSLPTT